MQRGAHNQSGLRPFTAAESMANRGEVFSAVPRRRIRQVVEAKDEEDPSSLYGGGGPPTNFADLISATKKLS